MGLNSFLSNRIRFVLYVITLQAICTKCPECTSEVSARLWRNSFCGCVLHATTCRNTAAKLKINSIYYISVLIIMLCLWQSESKSLILLLFVLLTKHAEEIISWTNEALLLQHNSTKCISYEINNSRPIYTIHKAAKMFWNNLYPTRSKKIQSFTLPVPVFFVSYF